MHKIIFISIIKFQLQFVIQINCQFEGFNKEIYFVFNGSYYNRKNPLMNFLHPNQPQYYKLKTKLNQSIQCQQLSKSYKNLLFDHLIGKQKNSQKDKQNTSDNKQNWGIRNSFKGLKKQKLSNIAQKLILSNIGPNLGSLNQFISNDPQNRILFTSKKKRQQQSGQENYLKRKIAQKNNQQHILLSESTSSYQKRLASKVMVEKIFENVYNTPIQDFYSTHISSKKDIKKCQRINISTLETLLHIGEGKNFCLRKNMVKAVTSQSQPAEIQIDQKKKKRTVFISFDKQTKMRYLNELKGKYHDLKKIQIPEQNNQFKILIEAQLLLDNQLRVIAQNINFTKRSTTLLNSVRSSVLGPRFLITEPINVEQRMEQVSQKFRKSKLKSVIYSDTIAKVTEEEVFLKRMQFKDVQMGLYMIDYLKLQKIKIIRLQNLKIQMSLVFLFIDVLCKFAPRINPLKQFSICSINIQNLTKFSEKIAQLLQQINIKKLCLNFTDIGSREFTRICIGISQNSCLQQIEMRNNHIDWMAAKPLQTLLKICKNLKRIDLRNNQIQNSVSLKIKDQRVLI